MPSMGDPRLRVVRHRFARAQRVLRIVPGDDLHHGRAVRHGTSQRTEVVGGVPSRARHAAEHADAPVGGLEPDDAAQRGRISDRARGVGADGRHAHARGHGHRRSAAGAAGYPVAVPGVTRGAVERVHPVASLGPLVHVGLAQAHGAGLPQPAHHRGVEVRLPVRKRLGAGGGAHPPGCVIVLDGNRDSVKRAAVAAGADLLFRRGRLFQGALRSRRQVRAQERVQPLNALDIELRQRHRRHLAAANLRGHFADAQGRQVVLDHLDYLR